MQIKETLSAERISVRDYRKADLPFLTAMWFDGENGKYLSDPTAEYVDDRYKAALDGLEDSPNGYYLTVVLKGTEQVVGSCCIFPDGEKESYDIGYCIHKNYWGQGYGTELVALVVGWLRDRGAAEITAEAARENTASNRLLRKNGFEAVREGEFKKYNMGISFKSTIYRLVL